MQIFNTSESHLVLPDGPTVPAKGNRIVQDDEWAKKASNAVVKAWIAAGALVVKTDDGEEVSVIDDDADADEGLRQGGNDAGETTPKTEAELNELKNDELKALIEAAGGEVKSTWNKGDLVKQALELKV
ncbi:hypothetical protein EVB51_027 [Rhizobium phage RHph_Y17]|uniref:Uncharacterized protein n=2 Tax=Kleczkowskavirus RHEph4 TaxID=1921526 RepID=A0A7S5USJ3_9CAUD|nr:hypothetical protein EVB51_027 [Rhizobium phage RHph_Y17]QIG68963.1 hypothetical protein EVB73_027 [Rhizobium phage RHph_Y3_43]QIG69512.1 hypothetical protein EVB80_029 [Rhizobium phage RHph_I36]QIG75386.1 hypothetical protein EVC17_029 [Rhizobium phage RHph_Y1_1]QIG75936.1 hypothetical protein EVC21_029 [Rhizobium phage RHph_Y2_17_2]